MVAKIDNLLAWSKKNGVLLDPHVSFEYSSNAGICARYNSDDSATVDAKLDGKLIRLPLDLAITPQYGAEQLGEFGHDIYKKSSNVNSVLKLYLAQVRTGQHLSQAFHEPYISALPTLFEMNSPYVWTPEEKALLIGTNLGNSLKENTKQLVEEWWQTINMIPESVPKPENHFINMKFYYEYKFYSDKDMYDYLRANEVDNWTSFPNYLWASMILKSRSFPNYLIKEYMKDDSIKQDEAMLLPIIDLLNHNMSAKVNWSATAEFFDFNSESIIKDSELFNNYGMKGNEELLLAYGFCIEKNVADSAALKIKVPLELLPKLESNGLTLPELNDYTTSVVRVDEQKKTNESNTKDYSRFEEGLLYFITEENVPENLIQLFQSLVRNDSEQSTSEITLRMKLAGLNQLRQAIETKNDVLAKIAIPAAGTSQNLNNIRIYIQSQRKIFASSIKKIKHLEKEILGDSNYKPRLVTLKSIYKKDIKFQQALLISLGISSYNDIIESQFQDQFWLLYLIRCFNKNEYEDSEDVYIPEWIHKLFVELSSRVEVTPAEILQYKELYQGLIPQLAQLVPEVFGKGKWGVNQLILSAKLLDLHSFVRGKEQECILVEPKA
ncbi:protein-lysine N-methyltransferase Efm1p [[Candida] anglica]|uniref:Protein-lysine N-methyltransferase Efm1p n=1 Tax=[Candida] anglica TaxID=148631 RepID=A0ABP0EMF9_9ASCO